MLSLAKYFYFKKFLLWRLHHQQQRILGILEKH